MWSQDHFLAVLKRWALFVINLEPAFLCHRGSHRGEHEAHLESLEEKMQTKDFHHIGIWRGGREVMAKAGGFQA